MKFTKEQLLKAYDFAMQEVEAPQDPLLQAVNAVKGNNIYTDDISSASFADPLVANVMGAYNKSTAMTMPKQKKAKSAPITYIDRRAPQQPFQYLPTEPKRGLSTKAKVALGLGVGAGLAGLGIATNTFGMGDKAKDVINALNGNTRKEIANLKDANAKEIAKLTDDNQVKQYILDSSTARGTVTGPGFRHWIDQASNEEASAMVNILNDPSKLSKLKSLGDKNEVKTLLKIFLKDQGISDKSFDSADYDRMINIIMSK